MNSAVDNSLWNFGIFQSNYYKEQLGTAASVLSLLLKSQRQIWDILQGVSSLGV